MNEPKKVDFIPAWASRVGPEDAEAMDDFAGNCHPPPDDDADDGAGDIDGLDFPALLFYCEWDAKTGKWEARRVVADSDTAMDAWMFPGGEESAGVPGRAAAGWSLHDGIEMFMMIPPGDPEWLAGGGLLGRDRIGRASFGTLDGGDALYRDIYDAVRGLLPALLSRRA